MFVLCNYFSSVLTINPVEAFVVIDLLGLGMHERQSLKSDIDRLKTNSDRDFGKDLLSRKSTIRTRNGCLSDMPIGSKVGNEYYSSQK